MQKKKKKYAEQFVMPGHEESNTVSNMATEWDSSGFVCAGMKGVIWCL